MFMHYRGSLVEEIDVSEWSTWRISRLNHSIYCTLVRCHLLDALGVHVEFIHVCEHSQSVGYALSMLLCVFGAYAKFQLGRRSALVFSFRYKYDWHDVSQDQRV